jgi:hypothetical protein
MKNYNRTAKNKQTKKKKKKKASLGGELLDPV